MSRSPNRILGSIVGTLFVVIGVLGLLLTGGMIEAVDGLLFGLFTVNWPQNVLHVLIGAALLLAAVSNAHAAKTANSVVGALCLVLGLVGLFLIGSPANLLAINVADNVLHFAAAVALLAVGLGAEPAPRSKPAS